MSRIVLVAREPALALQWRSELTAGGAHEVVAVTNGARSAQALLQQHRPQLVVCDLRLIDGTALAMIEWLGQQPQRPLIVAVAREDAEPLLLEVAARRRRQPVRSQPRAHRRRPRASNQTLRGETALTAPIARALLDHFERSHAAARTRHRRSGDEQSPLELEAPQRELLMRLAAGYRLEQVAEAQTVATARARSAPARHRAQAAVGCARRLADAAAGLNDARRCASSPRS